MCKKIKNKNNISKLEVLKRIKINHAKAIKQKISPPILNNVMPIISSMEILILSYNNIKSNKGSMTPGTQGNTADKISIKRLEKISKSLNDNTFKFSEVRRIWIPKPKNIDWSSKKNLVNFGRPLGMPDFDSKIVQEAIRLVLDALYEPIFTKTNTNFGFRPNIGCQNAIHNLLQTNQGMSYALEGDIVGAFNNLNHEILIKILKKRIHDKKFLQLIYKCCKAGIFDQLQQINVDSLLGVPQGGISSPILWNIYMHELDVYILEHIQSFIQAINKKQNRSRTHQDSPQYKKWIYHMGKHRKKYLSYTKDKDKGLKDLNLEEKSKALEALSKYKQYKKLSLKTPSKNLSKRPLRISYIRYADDWILFTNGKKVVLKIIKNKIATFLRDYLHLTLSQEKTKITNLRTSEAYFLGFSLRGIVNKKISTTTKGVRKRTTTEKLYVGVDKNRLLKRMEWKRFQIKKTPREQPAWTLFTDQEIVSMYNSIIRGLVNYYAPIISYRSTINHYVYLLEYSCYKTLCHKHQITIRHLLKKYGIPITVYNHKHKTTTTLLTCKNYWNQLEKTVTKIKNNLFNKITDPELLATSNFLNNKKIYFRTKQSLKSCCIICGTFYNIEIHHIKHYRKQGTNTGFQKVMSLLQRRQVPVCKFHHQKIHAGEYDGNISLNDLFIHTNFIDNN